MTTKNKTINPDHEAAEWDARRVLREMPADSPTHNLARAYLAQSAELVCPCCLADPAFKGPCICKGTGKVSVGEQTLREMLVNERTRAERAEAELSSLRAHQAACVERWRGAAALSALSDDSNRALKLCAAELENKP